MRASGEVERCKARFVAKEFRQVEGIDNINKYAPTPAAASSRMLPKTAASEDMELRHVDVEKAFIQDDVAEEAHIELREKYQDFRGAVGKFRRALHGLVQAPRNWNLIATGTSKDLGFEQSLADPCLLRKVEKRGVRITIDYIRRRQPGRKKDHEIYREGQAKTGDEVCNQRSRTGRILHEVPCKARPREQDADSTPICLHEEPRG